MGGTGQGKVLSRLCAGTTFEMLRKALIFWKMMKSVTAYSTGGWGRPIVTRNYFRMKVLPKQLPTRTLNTLASVFIQWESSYQQPGAAQQ